MKKNIFHIPFSPIPIIFYDLLVLTEIHITLAK